MADQDVPKTETPVETTAEGSTAPAAPAVDPQTAAAAAGVPDALDPSAIEKHVALSEVARQISFYFGDANYPFDRFLFMLSRKSPEGWVPISIIASFKRMKPMRFLLTDEEIATSVEEAMQLQEDPLVEVDESKTKIRRKRELVPKKDAFARSAYVKGFGEETGELQKDLEAFFAEYGDIAQVRMRRDKGRGFKGSVFVEFHNFKELQEFVQLGQKADDDDERPKWEGHPLQIMTKSWGGRTLAGPERDSFDHPSDVLRGVSRGRREGRSCRLVSRR
ncbi:related to lhp1-rna binding protein [Ceraceosorus bombacis]|uniref:Related to lhp1-rna binding protein n=1 Tax=Ceraceosorus bombacis TaxID=401625 RepID=A0A0P1BKT4_9BASI|nr:related to lhp1-rna binding protein [Ceraceosorus bombacis]